MFVIITPCRKESAMNKSKLLSDCLIFVALSPLLLVVPTKSSAQSLMTASLVDTDRVEATLDSDDYEMIWIQFDLIDANVPGQPVISDPWITPCTDFSPTSLEEGMLIGLRQDHPSQPERYRKATDCERYLEMGVDGYIAGKDVRDRKIRWQLGANGSRMLGFPRKDTTHVSLTFPEIIEANNWIYSRDKPVDLKFSGKETHLNVRVLFTRLAKVIISTRRGLGNNALPDIKGKAFCLSERVYFVKPWMQTTSAPSGYTFMLWDEDTLGQPKESFQKGVYYSSHTFETHAGWTYHILVRENPGIRMSLN